MLTTNLPLTITILILVAVLTTVSKAEDETTDTDRVQFRPKQFAGKLMPYDLEKIFRVNKEKAKARKAYNYSSFLVKEFNEHYYPMQEFQWHHAGSKFRNVGIRKSDENTIQEVFLSWTSLSDGLQWGFFNGELERTTKADPFSCIGDVEIANKVKKNLLDRKLIEGLMEVTDVFRYRTRSIVTEQKSSQIKFPAIKFGEPKYGVSVSGATYFFNAQGEEAK